MTGRHEHRVRDFYHDAYYSAFFVARFALVSANGYDCSIHREIRGALIQHFTGQGQAALAQETKSKLEALEDRRNVADYVFSGARLGALAAGDMIRTTNADVQELFTAWNIP